MPIAPFSIRLQEITGAPAAGRTVTLGLAAAPFTPRPAGVISLAPVMLTTDGDGLAQADLATGELWVSIAGQPRLRLLHLGGAVPDLLPPMAVSGQIRQLDGAGEAEPVTISGRGRALGRNIILAGSVTLTPVAGVVTATLLPGQYHARKARGPRSLIDVPGEWLSAVLGDAPENVALWGAEPALWGLEFAVWGEP